MVQLPATSSIDLAFEQGWLTIWFATPENRNALSDALVAELRETLDIVRDDRSVRGITLRGKGGVFCAGGDLKSFQAGLTGGADRDEIIAMNTSGGELFHQINTMPQVVVALVEGAAIAGGLGMVCCADVVAVTADAKFSLTETQLGIAPAQIAPYVVHRVGLTTARRLMLTGARFNGEAAHQMGLSDFLSPDADGLDEIDADIRKNVMRCAPGANAATKDLVLAAPNLEHHEMRARAASAFADCLLSDEGREGIGAFIEKRKPRWAQQD